MSIIQARNALNQSNNTPEPRDWDTQADTYALNANHMGKTIQDISEDMTKNGYKGSLNDVLTNLNRLGVRSMGYAWDNMADAVTISAHIRGQTISQIESQLNARGYAITKAEVGQSLNRQGVNVPTQLCWDRNADFYAAAGARAGKSAWEISAELRGRGYAVVPAQVTASLQRQLAMQRGSIP